MTAHALTRQVRTGGQTDGSRTYIANRGSSHIECITAIHPNSDAARETPYRNSGAAGLWEKDMTGIKVRDRFDVQPVDDGAIIKGNITEVVQG